MQYSTSVSTTCVASSSVATVTVVDGTTQAGTLTAQTDVIVDSTTQTNVVVVGGITQTDVVVVSGTQTVTVAAGTQAAAAGNGASATSSKTSSTAFVASGNSTQTGSGVLASESQSAESSSCNVFPEEEEGPYYISGEYIRSDLTDGEVGIPFTLYLNLIDTNTCGALANAAVDIWSANATGYYSGFTLVGENLGGAGGSGNMSGAMETGSMPTGAMPTGAIPSGTGNMTGNPPTKRAVNGNEVVGQANDGGTAITDAYTFGRGIQITDSDGGVTFKTIVPGWYNDRTMHIHTKIHIDGQTLSNGTYIGGSIAHTAQLFFGEDFSELVASDATYAANTVVRTLNSEDTIYTDQSGEDSLISLYYVSGTDLSAGIIGELTIGVDPTATPAAVTHL